MRAETDKLLNRSRNTLDTAGRKKVFEQLAAEVRQGTACCLPVPPQLALGLQQEAHRHAHCA
jgi:hypothetical protein